MDAMLGLRRWTRHEYERLMDHGVLNEDDPVELLDGLLLVKEPQHSRHRTAVLLAARAVERAFGEGWFVQTQSPIILDDRSEPEPDVCVVRGSPRDYVDAHPMRPALIVESRRPAAPGPRRKVAAHARAGSRTTGSLTRSIACSRFIASRRDQVRPGATGATRRSRHWRRRDDHAARGADRGIRVADLRRRRVSPGWTSAASPPSPRASPPIGVAEARHLQNVIDRLVPPRDRMVRAG